MENNRIYIGDALQTLREFPDNFVDICVLSPPFNKLGVAGGLVKEVKYNNSIDSLPEYQYQKEQIAVLNELYRVTKPNGHIFYDHKLRWFNGIMFHPMTWLSKTNWNMRQEIIWDRTIASNIQSWRFWQIEHRIYWMQKGITKGEKIGSKHAKLSSIWKIRPEMKSNHPAPFPIQLPTRCIYSIADDAIGLNVLDPYAGFGTTLLAAKLMKHNYIGIDCSPEYVNQANARLTTPPDNDVHNVTEEMNLHCVEKSYAQRKSKQKV